MATSSPKTSPKRRFSKLEGEFGDLLELRVSDVERILQATEVRDAAIKAANEEFEAATEGAVKRLAVLDEELGAFLQRNRYQLTRRLGQTIKHFYGDVKFVLEAPSLEIPKGEKAIIQRLEGLPGGAEYLIYTPKLNRRALQQAPASLLRLLHPFGVWKGRHYRISVKSVKGENPKILSHKRYNERKVR